MVQFDRVKACWRIDCGQLFTSRGMGFSPYKKPMRQRADPDEETHDRRAVCGKTARTVRREGRYAVPTPIDPLARLTKVAQLVTKHALSPPTPLIF